MLKTALALGTFDGVHKGHKAVLSLPEGYHKIAVTFKRPPKMEQSGAAGLLMTYEDKCRALIQNGMDEVKGLLFCEVCHMPPTDFLRYLKERFSPSLISCGFNYRFGKNAAGDTNLLRNFCKQNGIVFRCCDPVSQEGEIVSSTAIRSLLQDGKIEQATAMLSEPFSFSAKVIAGDQRGRTWGFPTINQRYPQELTPLRFGVYKTKVTVGSKSYFGMTNIGVRPTFQLPFILSETYIADFSGDLYGKTVRITPLVFVRPERKFSSAEELRAQIQNDLQLILK